MKLSRTVAYAIHATLQLADGERGTPIPCSQLANDGRMPERFLLQILRGLVTHGLLSSTRGVDGGYCLAKSPEQISLRDIFDAFENPLDSRDTVLDDLAPEVRKKIVNTLTRATDAARRELGELTLNELVRADRNSG